MQKTLLLFIIVAMAACQPGADKTATAKFDEEAEKKAILQTIEQETSCFYRRDYECWKQTYVQADYAFQGWNNGDGTFDAKIGWSDVDKKIGSYIKDNPLEAGQTSSHPIVEKKDLKFKFFSDKAAYLVWNQYNSDREKNTFMLSREQRIMEKIDGKWKIANVSAFWDYKNIVTKDSLQKI